MFGQIDAPKGLVVAGRDSIKRLLDGGRHPASDTEREGFTGHAQAERAGAWSSPALSAEQLVA